MSLAAWRGGNRIVIPNTPLREAEMSTTEQDSNIPSTAVEFAPGGCGAPACSATTFPSPDAR